MTCGEKLWSFCTPFRHSETIVSDGTQRQIMVILRLLSSIDGEPNDMRRQIMVIPHPFCHPETIESDDMQRQIMVILHLLSSRGGKPEDMQRYLMVICAFRQPRGMNSAVSGWCWSFGADHFQNFCKFRWQGYWPAEWCSTRTKLVSYLYFPFISNKRQVKRGNCHTLISSGDHLFGGMRPSLDHFEVLGTHR